MNKHFSIFAVLISALSLTSCQLSSSSSIDNISSPTFSSSHMISSEIISSEITSSSIEVSSTSTYSSSVISDIYEQRREYYNIPANYVERNQKYYEHNQVAAYIAIYQDLPSNYSEKPVNGETKIGGVHQNREQQLPLMLTYTEIDVNTYIPNARGTHRIVYSNTFRIFYTADHYKSFKEYIGYDNFISDYSMNME